MTRQRVQTSLKRTAFHECTHCRGTGLVMTPLSMSINVMRMIQLAAHRKLAKVGYGVLIHDAYRPWHVTKVFWEATPKAQHTFVADPALGTSNPQRMRVLMRPALAQ